MGQGRARSEDHGRMSRVTSSAARARGARARGARRSAGRRAAGRAHPGDGRPLRPPHPRRAARVESYGEPHRRWAAINADARSRVVEEAAPRRSRRWTATTALGPVVGMHALRAAMRARARAPAWAWPSRATSNHFGAIAPYCWLAAQEGFASVIGSNCERHHRAHRRARGATSATVPSASACPTPGAIRSSSTWR